jgi:hypothetical protein
LSAEKSFGIIPVMKSFEAKVSNIEKLPAYRIRVSDRSQDLVLTLWRMSVAYLAEDAVYEIELHEPLKRFSWCA